MESISHEQWLARIRAEQQASWKSGLRTPIEAYLERHPQIRVNRELLLDLVYSEIVLCRQRGDAVVVDDYLRRFPDLADDLRREFEFDQFLDDILPPARDGSTLAFAEKLPLRFLSIGTLPRIEGYDVLAWIESGSFGDVYRARDHALNRLVALKVLKRSGRVEEAHFKREAQLVASLNQPECFVQIFGFDESQGQQYFAMELMEGGTLKDHAQHRPLPPAEIARLMEQVARAIQTAHDLGVVHRDLKPSNVLLTRDGVPKIADFGLAKKLNEESTLTPNGGAALGTIAYMAPEQARSGDVGPRADIYGLGGLLYFLLCGRAPLAFDQHERSLVALQRILHEIPASPRRMLPKGNKPAPRSMQEINLETICLKCLAKNPAQRYASAGEVADRLRMVHKGEKIPERPPGLGRRFSATLRRRPARSLAAAAVVALALLVTAALAILPRRDPPVLTPEQIRVEARARIADALRTKGRYVFGAEDALPSLLAWGYGEQRPLATIPYVSFDTHGISLLELTDSPGVDHWRLSALVRHKLADGFYPAIGFYFSLAQHSGPGFPPPHSCYRYSFYDHGRALFRETPNMEPKGRASFHCQIIHEKNHLRHAHGYGHPCSIKANIGSDFSPWRRLQIDVTPHGVRTYCEDQDGLQLIDPFLPLSDLGAPVTNTQHAWVTPVYSSLGSVGLLVEQGQGDFTEITLERLDP